MFISRLFIEEGALLVYPLILIFILISLLFTHMLFDINLFQVLPIFCTVNCFDLFNACSL